MKTQEGVIQFALEHEQCSPPGDGVIAELQDGHARLHKLGLIGRDAQRYEGYAFGNMSARLNGGKFIISGTQTGSYTHLDNSHYTTVDDCNIESNHVTSHGPVKPSSECMTHASIYAATPGANAIAHIHSPELWRNHKKLGMCSTAADIEYGTPAMAAAVKDCISELNGAQEGCIAMLGHEDGVICYAGTVTQATNLVLSLWGKLNVN